MSIFNDTSNLLASTTFCVKTLQQIGRKPAAEDNSQQHFHFHVRSGTHQTLHWELNSQRGRRILSFFAAVTFCCYGKLSSSDKEPEAVWDKQMIWKLFLFQKWWGNILTQCSLQNRAVISSVNKETRHKCRVISQYAWHMKVTCTHTAWHVLVTWKVTGKTHKMYKTSQCTTPHLLPTICGALIH